MKTFTMTKHARRRSQQRAFRNSQIAALFGLADLSVPVDRHLSALRFSRTALSEAVADGMAPADADRLARRTMVVSDDGAILTVAHLHGPKSRKYCRRDRRAYWRGAN